MKNSITDILISDKNTIFCSKGVDMEVYKILENSKIDQIKSFGDIVTSSNLGSLVICEDRDYLVCLGGLDGCVSLIRDRF